MNASYLQGVTLSVAFGGLACSSMAPMVATSHPLPPSATGAVLAPAPLQSSASPVAPDAGLLQLHPTPSPPSQPPPSHDPAWQATLVQANGLDVGDFAVAAGPEPEHPKGMISALGWTASDPPDLYVVAIDVATVKEVGRVLIGPYDVTGAAMITSTPGGVVVALQGKTSIDLTWVDGGIVLGARRSLPGLGVDSAYDFRGFAGYDDRLVLADGGEGVTLRVLDQEAHLVARHKCHGTLFRPGPALLHRLAQEVVLTNLSVEDRGTPICSVGLRRGTPWHEAWLPSGDLSVWEGALYFTAAATGFARALGPDLQPTGKPVTFPEETPGPGCSGLTGTTPWDEATVGGFGVVDMISCCGDPSPGGLFICRPRATGLE
jgi:hypothetical protein